METTWLIKSVLRNSPDYPICRYSLTLKIQFLFQELFEAMAVEGLKELKIDMGQDSILRPLESRSFQDFSRRYPDLKRLDLERISVIDEDVLHPLASLKTLTLKSCENISALSKHFLRSLVNLQHFEMYHNLDIETIPDGFFDNSVQLRVLNLSTNGLVSLQPNLLRSLANLEELVLNNNYIENIPEDLFVNNAKLKILMWNEVKNKINYYDPIYPIMNF